MKLNVNRALLPVKAVYFTHLAGLASLVPYLPLYMSHLGLTATQIGLIRGLEPILALLFTHLWGSIADSFNQHRAVLLTAIGGATVFLFSTFFVPLSLKLDTAPMNTTQSQPDSHVMPDYRTPVLILTNTSTDLPQYLSVDSQILDAQNESGHESYSSICENICQFQNESVTCEWTRKDYVKNWRYQLLPKEKTCVESPCIAQDVESHNRTSPCGDINYTRECLFPANESTCYECILDIDDRNNRTNGKGFVTLDVQCVRSNLLRGLKLWNTSSLLSGSATDVGINFISCNCHDLPSDEYVDLSTDSILGNLSTFFLLLILVLFSRSFMCTTSPILHSTTMELLGQKQDDFGKQRIWGAFGWGAFALISGTLIDHFDRRSKGGKDHFDPAFYLFLGFMLAAEIAASFIVFPPQTSIKSQCQNIPRLIRKPEILGFLVTVCILGMGFGVIGTFLFPFLQEQHASHTLMGLTLTITCIAELPFLFVSNRVIRFTGHIGALCFSLFCYTVRFLGYSLITNPWAVIPFEMLHGVTYGLSWAACTSYANQNAPPGLALTLQAVFASVHMGFGKGLGTLLGGVVYDHFGSRILFRASAFVVGLSGLLYLGLYHVFTKRHPPVLYTRFRTEEGSGRRGSSRRESSTEGRVPQSIKMASSELEQLEDPPTKLDSRSMRLALRDINRPASPMERDHTRPSSSRDHGGSGGYQAYPQHAPVHQRHAPPCDLMVRMPCGYYHHHTKRRMDSLDDDEGSPGTTSLAALIHSEQGGRALYGVGMERVMLHNIGVNMMAYLDDVDLDQAMDAV